MANLCDNYIYVGCTDSEWREISEGFNTDAYDWPMCVDGPVCNDGYERVIRFVTNWSPTPIENGKMAELSKLYPTATFHYEADIEGIGYQSYFWYCGGDVYRSKSDVVFKRSLTNGAAEIKCEKATTKTGEGTEHRIELMPDGRVAADGLNLFNECDIYDWKDIQAISCGCWHTVGLQKNGKLIACGSNANNQCDVYDIEEKVRAVSCGRYHTAILLESGKVIVKGHLEKTEAPISGKHSDMPVDKSSFPRIEKLYLDKTNREWENINERIEHISVGDNLHLKKFKECGLTRFEVLNASNELVGIYGPDDGDTLANSLKNLKVTVASATPVSARRKGAKYAELSILIEYIDSAKPGKAKENGSKPSAFNQISVNDWPPVERIKSIFDAVVGITANGKIFIDGVSLCTQKEIKNILQKSAD